MEETSDPGHLQFLVKITSRARNINPARNAPLAVFDALYDAGRFAALRTVRALGRVHYLLAVCCLGDFSHGNSVSSKNLRCRYVQGPGKLANKARGVRPSGEKNIGICLFILHQKLAAIGSCYPRISGSKFFLPVLQTKELPSEVVRSNYAP